MKPVEINETLTKIRDEVAEVVVGLEDVVDILLVAMVSSGHVLLEGPPGLGKTTLAKTFARVIGGSFKRVQMTPDLLPADVLGVNVYNPYDSTWALRRGPIFANIVLVDEINRASPKVQSAFLEVMQERQATIENETLILPRPFMVLATQLPLGELGTYPLTSVQIDRFSYRVEMLNPDKITEYNILGRVDEIEGLNVDPVVKPSDLIEMTNAARNVYMDESVKKYIVDLVQSIRVNPMIRAGPSPRASIWLYRGARVVALMDKRNYVIPDDVKMLANVVIPHRVELTAQSRADEVSTSDVIDEVLMKTPVPKGLD